MNVIKEVPSKIFNKSLDKWILLSLGIHQSISACSYCDYYDFGNRVICPLSKPKGCWKLSISIACCFGLFTDFDEEYKENGLSKKAVGIADKIVDLIIERCVYEEEV